MVGGKTRKELIVKKYKMAKKNIKSVVPNVTKLVNGWFKSYKSGYKFEQEPLNEDTRKVLDDYFSNEQFGYE